MSSHAPYMEIDEYRLRLEKLQELKALGVEPYPHQFDVSWNLLAVGKNYEHDVVGTHEEAMRAATPEMHLAGRLVLLRAMGKNIFAHLQDDTGRLQIMFAKDYTSLTGYIPEKQGPEALAATKIIEKKIDLGDILGVRGFLFRTQKGELTLLVQEVTLLSKSLLPLPDKHAGLIDKQMRYRKRWLDLISHSEVIDTFKLRSLILRELRSYFYESDFMEVETPILQNTYGGAQARPFTTHLNALDQDMYLRISLEISLKKLLVGGFQRIFEIGKIFRNEGIDRTHNPEFTMVEAYAAYWDYNDMMRFVENLFEKLAHHIYGNSKVLFNGVEIDFQTPWKRLSMIDAIETLGKIPVRNVPDDQLRDILHTKAGMSPVLLNDMPRGLLLQNLFENFCEEQLIQPVHIIDHPIETTPLCKPHRDPILREEGMVERFESFAMGSEICNAYSELNDPILQRKLLEDQVAAKERGDEEAHPMDEEFLEALCQGMPPAGGIGIGIDRLVMLLSNCHSIRDAIFFPLMRPEAHE